MVENNIIEGWKTETINDICLIGRGRVINQIEIFNKVGVYPVYSSQSQNNGEMGRIDTYDFDGDYVTWTTDGAYAGTVFFRTGKFNCTNVCGTLREKESDTLDLQFLAYLLSTKAKYHVSYVGNPKLMNGVMTKISLQLPKSKAEQQSIANILSKCDAAIAHTEALIAKYTQIKTGLMQDLLTKGIDENGNIRSEQTHEFKEKDGFFFPKEWELTTVEKSIEAIEQGWSPNCDSDPASTNEWGILKTTAVTWTGYNENENKRMPKFLNPKLQYQVKMADVLITRAGPNSRVGVVAYVENTRDKLIFSDKIYRLIPKNKLVAKYLALALSSQFTQRHLSNFKTGMAESQTNISQKIVNALNILLPDTDEQKRVIEMLEKSEDVINKYAVQLAKLQSLKTGLMQDLLTGKVRVKYE